MAPIKPTNKYDDIINMPHHQSEKRPRMPLQDRAAQFSPFAALTGHGEAVKETARLTDKRIELDESVKAAIDEKLQLIEENIKNKPVVSVTYFKPDERKDGGAYITERAAVSKIDRYNSCIIMKTGQAIPIDEIADIIF